MNLKMDKMWPTYALEYYSAMKRSGVLTPATSWRNLKNTIVSDRSQAQKAMQCVTPHM